MAMQYPTLDGLYSQLDKKYSQIDKLMSERYWSQVNSRDKGLVYTQDINKREISDVQDEIDSLQSRIKSAHDFEIKTGSIEPSLVSGTILSDNNDASSTCSIFDDNISKASESRLAQPKAIRDDLVPTHYSIRNHFGAISSLPGVNLVSQILQILNDRLSQGFRRAGLHYTKVSELFNRDIQTRGFFIPNHSTTYVQICSRSTHGLILPAWRIIRVTLHEQTHYTVRGHPRAFDHEMQRQAALLKRVINFDNLAEELDRISSDYYTKMQIHQDIMSNDCAKLVYIHIASVNLITTPNNTNLLLDYPDGNIGYSIMRKHMVFCPVRIEKQTYFDDQDQKQTKLFIHTYQNSMTEDIVYGETYRSKLEKPKNTKLRTYDRVKITVYIKNNVMCRSVKQACLDSVRFLQRLSDLNISNDIVEYISSLDIYNVKISK